MVDQTPWSDAGRGNGDHHRTDLVETGQHPLIHHHGNRHGPGPGTPGFWTGRS